LERFSSLRSLHIILKHCSSLAEMDQINSPAQVVLRPSREPQNDQGCQSGMTSTRYHGQFSVSDCGQAQHLHTLWLTRLLATFQREMLKPKNALLLPFYNTQLTRHCLENTELNLPESSTPRIRLRRRISPTETRNPNTEAPRANPRSPTSDHGSEVDPHVPRHERRKDILLDTLQPLLSANDSDTSSILLCWGKESSCHVAAVKIPNSADDVTVWREIRQAWYAIRGKWRKFLPLFDVRDVGIVEVRRCKVSVSWVVTLTDNIARFQSRDSS
jgi:hypothetical protein